MIDACRRFCWKCLHLWLSAPRRPETLGIVVLVVPVGPAERVENRIGDCA